jgi:hypothetical protein
MTFPKFVDKFSKVPEMEKSCDQLPSLLRKMQNKKKMASFLKILRLNAK